MRKVDGSIATAEGQLKAGEINEAHRTVDQALRLDPTNKKLNSLMETIRPKYERLEKERVAALNPSERRKEQGDKKFKNAEFEDLCISRIASKLTIANCLSALTFDSAKVFFASRYKWNFRIFDRFKDSS